MKKRFLLLVLVVVFVVLSCAGCASMEREFKSLDSDLSGGLNRTVTVYDQNGQAIKQYKGKIDIQDTEYGNKVLFDLEGKRVVVYNGTVISEEN